VPGLPVGTTLSLGNLRATTQAAYAIIDGISAPESPLAG